MIQVEALDPELDDYVPVNRATLEAAWRTSIDNDTSETEPSTLDPLLPPLHRLLANEALLQGDGLAIDSSSNNQHEITITARLDSSNPLTEARWVKTGDIEGWITSLGLESKKRVISEWKGKITVSDPDPVSFLPIFTLRSTLPFSIAFLRVSVSIFLRCI